MPKYCDMRTAYIKQGKEKEFDMTIDSVCEYLMRQTDYDYKTSLQKLIQHDMNTIDVIREWVGLPINKPAKPSGRSNNQLVFDEFRTFLDEASINYYKTKSTEEILVKSDACIGDDWVNVEPTNEIISTAVANNICR